MDIHEARGTWQQAGGMQQASKRVLDAPTRHLADTCRL